MGKRNRNKGQSTLEYALVITVIMAGLVAINIYMKRGVQGKLRESADKIGEQYSAGKTTFTYTTSQSGNMVTREAFGLSASALGSGIDIATTDTAQGVSRYQVTTASTAQRSATGTAAESIATALTAEKLFE